MKKHGYKVLLLLVVALILATALVACNKDKNYTLSFETNGGAAIASMTLKEGSVQALPTPEERDGFLFEGWYLNAECTGDPVREVTVDKDMTVYAKWSPAYALSLKLSATETKVVYLKGGQNILSALADMQPAAPDGHIFGAWFLGDDELPADMVMPTAPLSLEAKYKVHFTAEVFVEQTNGTYTSSGTTEGYGYAGEYPDVKLAGHKIDKNAAGSVYGTLSDVASQNAYKVYMTAHGFILNAEANCPVEDVTLDDYHNEALAYNDVVDDLPVYGLLDEYILIGWSRDKNATVPEWDSPLIYDSLYDNTGVPQPKLYTVLEDDVTLYGVWQKGATDIFGGNDIVFLLGEDTDEPYVCIWRGEKFFKGDYTPTNGDFGVRNAEQNTVIEGRLNSDGTFSYKDANRKTLGNYALFNLGRLDNNVTVVVDEFNGVTYTDRNLESDRVSNGTYVLDEDGNYVATFEDGGPMGGRTVTIMVARTTDGTRVFVLRNDEDLELGEVYRIIDTSLYYPMFTFDGFFTATATTGSDSTTYYYSRVSENEIWLSTTFQNFDTSHNVLKLYTATVSGEERYVYTYYYENLDHAFLADDGSPSTLTLDGESAYKLGRDEGIFMRVGTSSVLQGTLIGLYNSTLAGLTLTRLVNVYSRTEGEGDDAVTNYYFKELDVRYAELQRLDSQTGYARGDYMLVIEDEYTASLYSVSSFMGIIIGVDLVASGDYMVANEGNNTYKFVVDQATVADGDIDPGLGGKLSQVEYFEFGMASASGSNMFYYVAYKLNDDSQEVRFDKVYLSEDGQDALTIIGTASAGFATFETGGRTYSGVYSTQDFIFILTYAGDAETYTLYLQLDDDNGTYAELELPLGQFFEYSHGSMRRTNYLTFDGKGGATLYQDGQDPIEGTFAESEDYTVFADLEMTYMTFTSADESLTFNYMFMAVSGTTCFVRFDQEASGEYTEISATSEPLDVTAKLVLDGFYVARYFFDVQNDEEYITVPYFYDPETNAVRLSLATQTETYYAYFDLKSNKQFTERGAEYTDLCLLYDNAQLDLDYAFQLDGYGALTVLNGEDGEVAGSGTYTFLDDDGGIEFTFKLDADPADKAPTVYSGQLGYVTLGNSRVRALLIEHDESVEGTYVVTDDLTVLHLDRFGNAVFVNKMGMAYRAMYQIVDDKYASGKVLIFFTGISTSSTSTSKDPGLFVIDVVGETVSAVEYASTYSYYTQDLEALQFSRTGYVYIGAELAFYTVGSDKNVTIYRSNGGEGANDFGFVKDNSFGQFTQEGTKTFDQKTYYYNTEEGFGINFGRAASGKDDYPLSYVKGEEQVSAPIEALFFIPLYTSATADFTVSGNIRFLGDSQTYACTVVRRVLEGDEVETYILISDNLFGNYRFDITVSYNGGSGNTFTVTRMRRIVEMNAYQFEYVYWMMYLMYGSSLADQVPDEYGSFKIETEYDVTGEITLDKFYGAFGTALGLTDDKGVALDLAECDYTYEELRLGYYMLPCYAVTVKGTDGYDYTVRFAPQAINITSSVSTLGYIVAMITRTEEFSFEAAGDMQACTLTIERIVYSDQGLSSYGVVAGRYYDSKIVYGDETFTPTYILNETVEGVTYKLFVVRMTDGEESSETITRAMYFRFDLKDAELAQDSVYRLAPFDSATAALVSADEYVVLYSADETQWIDYNETTHEVGMFCYNRTVYLAETSVYDENAHTVTVTVSSQDDTLQFTILLTESGESGGDTIVQILPQE